MEKNTHPAPDGFETIEYPLDFSFKAVCVLHEDSSVEKVEAKIYETVSRVLGSAAVKRPTSNLSKAGNYVSVTIVSTLINRQQLEGVYTALSGLDIVKMTL